MQPEDDMEWLRFILNAAVQGKGFEAHSLAEQLGVSPGRVSMALGGETELREWMFLLILRGLQLEPAQIIAGAGLGKEPTPLQVPIFYPITETSLAEWLPPAPDVDWKAWRREAHREVKAFVARERQILGRRILQRGWTAAAVSRELGRGINYVGQVLRGQQQLGTAHVLAILKILDEDPIRFYENAAGREPGYWEVLGPGVRWGDLIRLLRETLTLERKPRMDLFADETPAERAERERALREEERAEARALEEGGEPSPEPPPAGEESDWANGETTG